MTERWRLYSWRQWDCWNSTTSSWRQWDCWNSTTNEKIQSHVHSTLVSNEATGTHKLNLSDDFSLKNRILDLVNDVGLIREVSFMQSVLSQQEQKEEQLDIPVADAVMEARREINMCKAYPQDVTLSTFTLGCVHSISFWMGMSSYKSQISIYLRGTWRMGLWMQKVMRKWGCNHRYIYIYTFMSFHANIAYV